MANIAVLGTGTWGMALARLLCNAGHQVTAWSALPAEIDYFEATHRHPNLPGMEMPEALAFTKDLQTACTGRDILVFAVPSVFVRGTAAKAAPFIPDGQVIVDVAKGIEADTLLTLTEVIAQELQRDGGHDAIQLVALSGPTHAEEVARDLPTTIVSACRDEAVARLVQQVFMTPAMRVYTNSDVRGVELCGALKNIIALAAGISQGLGYGDNAKAAIITRGITEMARLGLAMGCPLETFSGLAGLGDLVVTCTSVHSRNNRCGNLIGQGHPPKKAIQEVGQVVEGVFALPAAVALAEQYGVEMPLITAVNAVVNQGADPRATVNALMGRPGKDEVR